MTVVRRRESARRRQVRLLRARRAGIGGDTGARFDAAVHFNGLCGDPDCGPQRDDDQPALLDRLLAWWERVRQLHD